VTPKELRQHRERLGLTQQDLAVRLDVVVMTVSKWERGIHRIPESVALAVQQMRAEKGAKSKRRS
jgi:DNA-binding transcriptional regulator YiaG